MRPDMAKVVTERPRHGSADPSVKTAGKVALALVQTEHGDGEDFGPTRAKVSRRGQACNAKALGRTAGSMDGYKTFSDLLGPLRGYLKKQVGRPWDDVYSELRANLDFRTVAGQHIWDHVRQEVALHTELVGRQVWVKAARFRSGRMVDGLFVHPTTRLLCYVPEKRFRYRAPVDDDVVKLDRFTSLCRFVGIWYRVEFGVKDVYVPPRRLPNGTMLRGESWREEFVQIRKKQLSRAELLAHGLKNAQAA